MQELKAFARVNARSAWTFAASLLLLFQFAGFVSVFSASIDPRSLLSSRNADASHIVGTAARTRWYKDNGESAYGALYYRLAHTFAFWAGRTFANDSSEPENVERAHSVVLMTMSLLAAAGIAFLLSCSMLEPLAERLLFTFLLLAAFMTNLTWATFIFFVHPDMLFGLFVLSAFFLTVRALREPQNDLWFKTSALLWGLAGMVKLTFVIFLPPLIFLWVPPFTGQRLRLALRYYLWMLPGYLIAGFPQSFNFPRSIKFLIYQSKFSQPATYETVSGWWKLLGEQLWLPLILVLAGAVLYSHWRKPLSWRVGWRLLPVVIFPFLVISLQNTTVRSDYYLIPVVSLILAFIVEVFPKGLRVQLDERFERITLAAILMGVVFTVGAVPRRMEAEQTATFGCRAEAESAYREIHREVESGSRLVSDPHFPYDRNRVGDKVRAGWSNTWAEVKSQQANALALNWSYYYNFTDHEPTDYTKADVPQWEQVREFYKNFRKASEARDPDGHVWRKVREWPSCGYEIWKRE